MNKPTTKSIMIFLISVTLILVSIQSGAAGDDLWTTQGPYGLRLFTLIVDPIIPTTIYAFSIDCENNGVTSIVFKSLNGGIDWFPSGDGIPLSDCGNIRSHGMVMDPEDSNILYVANQEGIYKTMDGAGSWSRVSDMRTASLAISPHGKIYAGVYEDKGYTGGVYHSEDGGETWEFSGTGLPAPPDVASALAVAPSAQHIIYAGYQGSGLYKSVDGGDTWQPINNGFFTPPQVRLITVDPYDSQVVYFSAMLGLTIFRSDNGGTSWQPIGDGLPSEPYSVVIDPGNQQVLYAGTWGGVYRCLDNLGENWEPFNDGMGSRLVTSLAIDHQEPQNIYAGTQAGVWKLTLVSDSPQDYSITINNGSLYTNQAEVTLNLTAPNGTSQMIVSNDGGFSGSAWEPYGTTKPWIITTYGSYSLPRTVYVKFKKNGSVSGLYQDDIIYDPIAPSGSVNVTDPPGKQAISSLIPVGLSSTTASTIYLPAVANNDRPGYTLVHLHLSAEDDLSGVDEMILSNDLDFATDQWESFVEEADWWVPKGVQTVVSVMFRDRAGNQSPVASDTYHP